MNQMTSTPAIKTAPSQHAPRANNKTPLIIVTVLFFMWGLLTALNDVLIPHLKAIYQLNYVEAMLVQFCFFGAYFIVSLPAGFLIKRIGYQNGVVTGLFVAAIGCALFYPASVSGYSLFLIAFFILASGITILQVAANPFVTVLGDESTASSRLTLTQAFNSLGTTIAPALGGFLILSAGKLAPQDLAALTSADQVQYHLHEAASVQIPYLILAAALFALGLAFKFAKLPVISSDADSSSRTNAKQKSIFSHTRLVFGVIAIFVYVGGEVSVGSFMVSFLGDHRVASLPAAVAAGYASFYWGGAMVGRFIGFAVMRVISPGKVLAFNASMSIVLILTAMSSTGPVAMWAILLVGLCNSIMFPTIFSMALYKLGDQTGQGSGLLCMAIVGGAVVPFAQGYFADTINLQASYLVPAACYIYIVFYGLKYRKRDAH